MMTQEYAIELVDVKKSFKVDVENKDSRKIITKRATKTIVHKVLDGINIRVKKGELLGIIGLNGSGKSTLLSIMAKIMEPDEGKVIINGKVSSILELGMGFHPDLTGRENIYIKSEMYGFSKKEIDSKIEDIIDFSGIRNYIDNPIRTYSSGMSARLAFSIMINVEAEIMLLDEILSTGDISFATKASLIFKKQLKDGKTVVFASQNIAQLESMCTRVIWIDKGKIVADGPTKVVLSKFQNSITNTLSIIIDFATAGVPEYQYKLAIMYRDGVDVESNQSLYEEWIHKASDQGHLESQLLYADLLLDRGDQDSCNEAVVLYQSAANKGNAKARLKLSTLQSSGNDIDRKEIQILMKQLAERGNPINKFQYSTLMLNTAWNEKEREEAFLYTMEAVSDGNPEAMVQAANMFLNGIGTNKNIEKYIEMLECAAEKGNINAIKTIGDIYLQGKLVEKDENKAFNYYLKGACLGAPGMQYQVASMYREGIGVLVDIKESEKWYKIYSNYILAPYQLIVAESKMFNEIETEVTAESLLIKAASSYNQRAIGLLANMYRGDGVIKPNLEKARYYYKLYSSWTGIGRINLADMYYKGLVFEQDFKKAADLYKELTYTCDPNIDYRLYLMYKEGLGFEKDMEKSMFFLQRASSRGNMEARKEIMTKRVKEVDSNGRN